MLFNMSDFVSYSIFIGFYLFSVAASLASVYIQFGFGKPWAVRVKCFCDDTLFARKRVLAIYCLLRFHFGVFQSRFVNFIAVHVPHESHHS